MPLSQTQNEHEKSKETIQKTKRCGTHRRNKFLLLSTKEDSNKARITDKNINNIVGISKDNSDYYIIKNVKHPEEKLAASKRMIAETHEDEMLLRALKNNLNSDDIIINLKSQEKGKKCNTGKYICHCKEENCFTSSSKKSSSRMLGSSKIDKPQTTNYRRLTKYENAKPDILQQKSPALYHENPYELPLSNLMNHFSIQPYEERISIPPVPILYEIIPDVSPHMIGNERKYINVGVPVTSFEGRPNYLVGNQYQPIIHDKPCIYSTVTEKRVESSRSVTSSSTNNVEATTIRGTTNDLELNNLIGQTEEDQEQFPTLTTEASNVDLSTNLKTNLHLNDLPDVNEEINTVSSFNLNEIMPKSEDSTEQIETNPDNDLSKLTTYSTDYVGIGSAPSFIYGMNDGKLINMEECIQLFGRDVCVLRATSPKMLAKQAQENNPNKYFTIRIPEYVTQMSTRKETTLNNIDYLDKFKTTDPYLASETSTDGIHKSNINLNKYLESTSAKSKANIDETSLSEFHQSSESIKQISEPDVNYNEKKSLNTIKNTQTPMKKLMDPAIDKNTKTEKNKLLGKSKSHTTNLLLNPNNEEITNSTSGEKSLYSSPSSKPSSDKEANNLKINQQNQVTNISYYSNTSPKEETTVISYDSKTKDNSKEQNRNYLKESNTNSEKKIPQKDKEETTTTSSNSKIGYNFEKEPKEIIGIKVSAHPEEISQESTTMQYFDDKKSSNLKHREDTTNNLEVIDSSTSRLPFCDNTLLLNSIRKVINDFASDTRLTKTNDFDDSLLQTQGKNLLPEILQVPNLKNILSIPQIENTIVQRVKDILSYVTAIPKRDFTNDWSHGVIKNTLHSMLDALSDVHHKLPPMILEEHQFKDGQWETNLVTLAPISDQKASKGTPENLRESIKELLSSPAIASQTDQHIVRNMIVQSVKNSLTNDTDDKIYDSIINALNDVLQTLKNSKDINALGESNKVNGKVISDKENMDMTSSQKIPTSNYKVEINVDDSKLNKKQNLNIKEDEMDSKTMQKTDYQKAKTLENHANISTTEFPHLLQLSKEEETTDKVIAKMKENITDFGQITKTDVAEKKLVEPLEPKITYHKAVLQNNPNILAILKPDSTGSEQYIKNHHINEENVKDTTNFMQETSPNYAQVSDSIILENVARTKDIGEEVKHTVTEETLTTSTEIDPLIILERIKFNLPPTKYYSPEILKYTTNHHIDDKNVEITTASTNFMQETPSNYAQMSDNVILQNTAETKNDGDEMKYPLTTTSDNLISSKNVENKDYKPKIISLIGKNILESQPNLQQNVTEDNIVKIHEVTTEVQRTYTKTTYFKAKSSSNDNPKISSPLLTYETTDIRINNQNKENNNSNNGNNNLFGNKINNIDNAKKVIVSSSASSARNDIDLSQLVSSSIAPDDISELQKSQLYYISDGVKLPLEIKRLEDGSYALSISKHICEQILTRKCPCCVPLQGYVIGSLKNHQQDDMHPMTSTIVEEKNKKNMYVNNIKKDYQSVQPFNTIITSMITRRNALRTQKLKEEEEEEEKEEEKINSHYPWKQNNDNLATISMPVIDFAKKYNLVLNFNEEKILFNEVGLQDKMQNYDKSIMKSREVSEYDQSEKKNLNNYLDIKKNRLLDENIEAIDKFEDLINVRQKKNIPNMNFPIFPITQKLFNLEKNSDEFEGRKANAEMNQSGIYQRSKLREAETANDIQNMNIVQKINSEDQKKINPVLKGINISEKSKISKDEMKWYKLSDIAEGNYYIIRNKN